MIAVLFSDSSPFSPPTRYLWKTLLATLSCHIEFVKKFELQNSDSKNSPVTYAPKVYVRKSFIVDTINLVYGERVCQCFTQSFLGIPVHISTLYLSGTEGLRPWFGAISGKSLEFNVARLA